jgi:hypothetical protein
MAEAAGDGKEQSSKVAVAPPATALSFYAATCIKILAFLAFQNFSITYLLTYLLTYLD